MMELNIQNIIDEIPVIDSSSDYWLVRSNSGDYYTDFFMNNYVGVGWNHVTMADINHANNDSTVIKTLLKNHVRENGDNPDDTAEQSYGTWANQLIKFTKSLKINDIVIVPSESSEYFLVGNIVTDTYELDDAELEEISSSTKNYKVSRYMKRRKVKWLGRFSRDKADTALYKMIYSQHTLSNVNGYKSYINRAMFDAYIEDDELHLTFDVTQQEGIDSEYLGQFMYQISKLAKSFDSETKVIAKLNVQSPGSIEAVFKKVGIGIAVVACIGLASAVPYGGEFKIGNDLIGELQFEIPGLLVQHEKVKDASIAANDEHNEKTLKIEKEAVDTAVELKVPISELGLNLPDSVQKSLQAEVNRREKEQENKNEQNHEDSTQTNVTTDSDSKNDNTK